MKSSESARAKCGCFRNLTKCFKIRNAIGVDNEDEELHKCSSEQSSNRHQDLQLEKSNKSEIALKSAMLIQRWYRRYQSRIEIKKKTAWNIYQSIEYSGEQDQLKLCNFFLTLIKNSALLDSINPNGRSKPLSLIKTETETPNDNMNKNTKLIQRVFSGSVEEPDIPQIVNRKKSRPILVEPSYNGVVMNFPVVKQNFHDLVNSFKLHKILHAKYVIDILEETLKNLKTRKNINKLSTSTKKQVTVVGDLHGQLDDLLLIFYKNGFPSDDNPYLFNGDFVDRGTKSIEVSLIIFCGFLMSDSAVYINRGNHEDHVMNVRYGFIKEICFRYANHSKKICCLYDEIFSWLPLASLIDDKIFVVHGGISDTTHIKDIDQIKREKYSSILKPPILDDNGELIKDLQEVELIEWQHILDALWSDPRQEKGIRENTFRGGGCCFGPDITNEFLAANNLDFIIRSHECKESGYEYTHDDKVLTIFSCSSYYEYGSNNGAYAKITSKMKPIIVQFFVKQGDEITKNLTIRERINVIEVSAINHLLEKFISNKIKLNEAYKAKDLSGRGVITLNEWCTITGDVLDMKLPWRTLRPKLAKLDKDGLVLYESTFEGLQIYNVNETFSGLETSITENIYRHKAVLETIFRAIDKDHSGQISKEEFRNVCELINQHDPTAKLHDNVIEDLANTMDIDKDGLINFNEFLEAFRIVSNKIDF